jgi:hypothetical protein
MKFANTKFLLTFSLLCNECIRYFDTEIFSDKRACSRSRQNKANRAVGH